MVFFFGQPGFSWMTLKTSDSFGIFYLWTNRDIVAILYINYEELISSLEVSTSPKRSFIRKSLYGYDSWIMDVLNGLCAVFDANGAFCHPVSFNVFWCMDGIGPYQSWLWLQRASSLALELGLVEITVHQSDGSSLWKSTERNSTPFFIPSHIAGHRLSMVRKVWVEHCFLMGTICITLH